MNNQNITILNNKSVVIANLARAFLLWTYLNKTEKQKKEFSRKLMPEIILRTMKLEGEKITRKDIEKILTK